MTSIRLIVLALIFAAVILAVEGMVTWIRANRGGVRAINERLRLIATGHDRPEVLARLRRDAWGGGIYLPGPLANTGRKLDNLLRGASFGMLAGRGDDARKWLTMAVAASPVFQAIAAANLARLDAR